MKVIKSEVKASNNEIEIVVLGDVHIGSPNFNETLLFQTIEYILEKENRFVILNGDILDCNFKDSVGNVYENAMTPSVALSYALLKLKPLADAKRILCTLGGNHDHDRSMKVCDISFAQQLAIGLEIPELFSADSIVLFLRVQNGVKGKKGHGITYKIFVNHGNNGGGGMIGSKANALEKMSLVVPNADLYIHSHTHSPFTFKDQYIEAHEDRCSITWRERLYVNTAAFLRYENSYGEKRLMKPQSSAVPKIKLKSKRVRINGMDRHVKELFCEI